MAQILRIAGMLVLSAVLTCPKDFLRGSSQVILQANQDVIGLIKPVTHFSSPMNFAVVTLKNRGINSILIRETMAD